LKIADNGLCKNSKGLKDTYFSIYYLAKFTIFLLIIIRKIVNFADFVK